MLNPQRHCASCGKALASVRSTKTYCSDACRKKAARGIDSEQQLESRWIIECLRRMHLAGKIWPVYRWDDSPPIFALLVPLEDALDELNAYGPLVTEGELKRALLVTEATGTRLKAEIKSFYGARKDRRVRKWD